MTNAVALAIKVSADARSAAAQLDGATTKVSKLGRAGQVAGRLLAAGLLVAVGAAIKFTQAAAEDAQAQQQLAQTAQQVTGATSKQTDAMESWIAAQGRAKGVADDELRPALSKLITATKDVGKAQELASLAMDISARTGKSLESVSQSLAKAQTGSVAGLSKYGVATKDAAGKAKSLDQVQRDLAKTYSGASAAAADTAAGKQKILAVQMDELQESIGAGLLPVMGTLVSIGLKVVDWISQNSTVVLTLVGALGTFLAILKAITIAQGVYNAVLALNPVVLIVAAVVALAVALVVAYKKSETFRNIVNAAFSGISKVVGATVDFIRDHWRLIIAIVAGPVGIAVGLVTKHWDSIKAGAQLVIGWVQSHWPALKDKVTKPFQDAKDVIGGVWTKVTGAFETAKTTLSTTADNVKAAVGGAFDAIAGSVQSAIDKVQSLIDKVQAFISKLGSIPGNPFGRVAAGGAGSDGGRVVGGVDLDTVKGRGDVHVHIHNHGHTLIGSEMQLAQELKRVLRDDLARFNGLLVTSR